jgi:hypothetical protein
MPGPGGHFDAIVGKGWAVARVYPARGLRPFGDFDLYVRPRDHDRLRALLARRRRSTQVRVDAHRGLSYLDDRDIETVFERSVRAPLGSAVVCTFGAEDQLRLSCLHALAEGLIRPVWLCDVALLAAAAPAGFDWEYFAGPGRRGEWCRAAVALAHELLESGVSSVPPGAAAESLPGWLRRSVLATWGSGMRSKGLRTPISRVGRRPAAVVRALVERWPLPIEATVGVGGRINAAPRLSYKLAEAAPERRLFSPIAPGRPSRPLGRRGSGA